MVYRIGGAPSQFLGKSDVLFLVEPVASRGKNHDAEELSLQHNRHMDGRRDMKSADERDDAFVNILREKPLPRQVWMEFGTSGFQHTMAGCGHVERTRAQHLLEDRVQFRICGEGNCKSGLRRRRISYMNQCDVRKPGYCHLSDGGQRLIQFE